MSDLSTTVANSYAPPVSQLLHLGEPRRNKSQDYAALGISADAVSELIRMATEDALNDGPQNSNLVWSPVHAWRALGHNPRNHCELRKDCMSTEILYKEESYKIVGACFEVYREKGCGFLEPVYQECMEIELRLQGILYVPKKSRRLNTKAARCAQPMNRTLSATTRSCWS